MKRTVQVLVVAVGLAAIGGCGGTGTSSATKEADMRKIRQEVTPATKFDMDLDSKPVTDGDIKVPDAAK